MGKGRDKLDQEGFSVPWVQQNKGESERELIVCLVKCGRAKIPWNRVLAFSFRVTVWIHQCYGL